MLSSRQRVARSIGSVSLIVALFLCRAIDPAAVSNWVPLPTSCGAITGLPCIFCGLTRALHLLLNGHFGGALYFNWLAFPFLIAVIALIALLIIELVTNRPWADLRVATRVNARRLTFVLATAVALWIFQAYLAVSHHKHELLNPRGPLYALFVK